MSYRFEMSEVQKGIYFECCTKDSSDYNIMLTLETKNIDGKALENAANFLVSEQEALHLGIEEAEDTIYMRAHEDVSVKIVTISSENEQETREIAIKTFTEPFDLSKAPLLRINYVKEKTGKNYLLVCMHHLIADGISMDIFVKRLFFIYDAMVLHTPFEMKMTEDVRFSDFIGKENKKLSDGEYKEQEEYRKRALEDVSAPEFIKEFSETDREMKHPAGSEIRISIPEELVAKVEKQSRELEVSEYMFQTAVYMTGIMKCTGSRNFAISSPFTYRPEKKDEEAIGCYIYNNPLFCKKEDTDSFESLVQEVRNDVFMGYMNIGYPNNLMLRGQPGNSLADQTVFDYTFIYDMYEQPESSNIIGMKDWDFCIYPGEITVIYQKIGKKAMLRLQYRKENVSYDTMENFGNRLLRIMEQVCEAPETAISDIDIFLPGERELLRKREQESVFFPFEPECVIDIFERKAAKYGEECALVYEGGSFTYNEINSMANAVAERLLQITVAEGRKKTAAIWMERSVEMVISVLGTLKAGWTYVPMDLSYTEGRIRYIEKDAGLSAVLTSGELLGRLEGMTEISLLCTERIIAECKRSENPAVLRSPQDAAYIEYTSGSTGEPKGVIIENQNIVNTVKDLERRFPLEKEDVYLFKTSLTFDISGTELYGWIVGKGKLCILPPDAEKDTFAIVQAIEEFKVTHINFVPSMLRIFVECLEDEENCEKISSLKWIFTGGEAINNDLVERFLSLSTGISLENVYGPTEATMWAAHYPLRHAEKTLNVPIGKALNEYRLYVVDKNMKRLPVMVPGELCISGAGVARGYLHKDDLTKKVFLDNPFWEEGDPNHYKRLYKTGDLARMLPDGNYEFLGRIDHQVKVNGIRIELGEIENVFLEYEGITHSVCLLSKRTNGDSYIVLCYSSVEEIPESQLRMYASKNLSAALVPSEYVFVEEMPRTLSEKIDRKALAKLAEVQRRKQKIITEPVSELEQMVVSVWKEVLNKEEIGIDENFFEAGGHSIALVRVHNLLCRKLQTKFPIAILLNQPTIRGIAAAIHSLNDDGKAEQVVISKKESLSTDDIAIVGMALDVPGAESIHEFWGNLIAKKDCIHEYTVEELEKLGIERELINNPNYIRRKGRLEDIEEFDSAFFKITPAEVQMMSPQLRLLYKGAWQAMEDAGIASGIYNERTGVYIGASDDFMWYQGMMFGNERYSDTYQIYTQSTNHFLATRLSYMFDFKGPAMSVLTGCSTSLVTAHLACKALLQKECDVALAGGVTVELPNEGGYLYEPNLMFSKDGKCKPFDDKADGTVFSNGMGIVVLKRLEDAKKDHDHIYAVIKGSAVRNDGKSKLSYTAPSAAGQVITMKDAYESAGIDPKTVTYIEAHGTGTKLGDPIEIDSLSQVFASSSKQFCTVGSVKGNIGHTDTAAGIIGLIKAALCLDQKYLPATLNYETPNQNIDFEDSPFIVKNYGAEWKRLQKDIPRRAGVNAFGVGGTNVHMILEETVEEKRPAQRRYNLFPVSAMTETALAATLDDICTYVEGDTCGDNLTDAAWSLTTGRKTFPNRGFFITDGKKKADSFMKKKSADGKEKRICFMFTGQGSQYQGMARDLYKNADHNPVCAVFKAHAEKIIQAIPEEERSEFTEILYGTEEPERMNQTRYSQIALFLTEYAMAATLMELGIKPDVLIGHSIGEVTAAAFAGVWSLEEAVKVVLQRAKLMQEQEPGVMLSVGASREQLEGYVASTENVWLSLCNTTGSCVVGGKKEEIYQLQECLKKEGFSCSVLKTSHAFHTPMMNQAAKEFEEFLNTLEMNEPKFQIISNITGNPVEPGQMSQPRYWSEQITHPVEFEAVLSCVLQEENAVFFETGGRTLCSLAKKHKEVKDHHAFISCIRHPKEKKQDIVHLLGVIGKIWCEGLAINWDLFYQDANKTRVYLPAYHFDKTVYPIKMNTVSKINSTEAVREIALSEEPAAGNSTYVLDDEILEVTKAAFREIFALENLDEDSDFFEIGGDSMQAASLAAKLQKETGVLVSVAEIFANTSPGALSDLIQKKRKESGESRSEKRIQRAAQAEYYPTSPAQRRMYTLYAMNRENLAYNLPSATLIEGNLDLDKAEKTFEKLVERHEILRTSFDLKDNEVVQIIHDTCELPFQVEKITGEFDMDALVEGFLQPFSLDKAPLMRVKLVQNEKQTLMLFDVHHIIADGTAVELLTRDFNELYAGDMQPLKVQYKDYAVWLKEYLQSPEMKKQEEYWLRNLSGNLPYLELPTDFERPAVKQFEGERYEFSVGNELSHAISKRARELGVTNFILVMSAWNLVLAKYSEQSEIIIGTSVSGRSTDDIRECIGMFVNMLAIRTFPEGEKYYVDYLQEMKKTVALALENQDYQFDTLVEKLHIPRRLDRNAVFDVCFDYHNIELHDLEVEGLTFKQQELKTGRAANELLLTCSEDKEHNISCFIDYATSIFKKSTIERMAKAFLEALMTIVMKEKDLLEKCSINDISIVSAEEKRAIEELNNSTYRVHDYRVSIPGLFKKWVEKQPEQTAIITSDGKKFTYLEIWKKVEKLAYLLQRKGADKEVTVAIIPHRDETMIAAIFAVLYTGAAYVPIDISYPDSRINDIIEQSNAAIVLGEKEVESRIKSKRIFIELQEGCRTDGREEAVIAFDETEAAQPDDLAYILFTSGSTGKPKGVEVTRKNLLNFIYDTQERGLIGQEGDRVCCITTPSFDIFGYEAITPLCSGSSIYICSQIEQLDAKKTAEKIVKYQVTHLLSAVSRLRVFVENKEFEPALSSLRCIMGGGENFPEILMKFLKENTKARIYNLYGPTETTIWSTAKELTYADNMSIGTPIANTRLYIMDASGHLLPRGVFGELCIAGDGVSRGYRNRKEETEKHFVESKELGGIRIYRTGDRARLLDSGEIELSGRIDSQIKLHGCRIELGEIEAVVQNSHFVENASAVVRKSNDGNDQLFLFYSNHEDAEQQLRNYIAGKLPVYMVPDRFVRMEKLPITSNGKIDRKFLEKVEIDMSSDDKRVTESISNTHTISAAGKDKQSVKHRILEIWKEVLHNDAVTANDNFFDVGGNSYSLMLAANKIGELLGTSMDLTILFEYPTVQGLVDYLKLDEKTGEESAAEKESLLKESLLKESLLKESESEPQKQEVLKQEQSNRKIAVVGMAGRFPEAENVDEFWKNIKAGKESIRFFEEKELLEAGVPKADIENPSYVKAKGYLEDVQYFDAKFFGMTKKEAQIMDPQIRTLMECCYHALEDANCDLKRYEGDIALFAGSSSNALWMSKFAGNKDIVDMFSAMTVNDKDFLTTQISYKLNLTGPSINVQTACSTSLVAICQAAQCLLEGDADMALAGGVSITYPRKEGYVWHENMIYSKDGHCRAFSDDATGTVSGNGCGVVVLKPFEKAVEDGDDIYAVLEGFAVNNDGVGKVGYSAPSIAGQKKVIEKALTRAQVAPGDIGYVEAHGTGTKLGDPIEIEALKQAWKIEETGSCAIGSVKANVGHLDAAAGVTGFMKAVNVLYHRTIPPIVNFSKPNPMIHMEETPFYVARQAMELKEKYNYAAVSAFGIGGTNAHAILGAAPTEKNQYKNEDMGLLLFSAKTENSLVQTAKAVIGEMQEKKFSAADVAHTLSVGRAQLPVRMAVTMYDQKAEMQFDEYSSEICFLDEENEKGIQGVYILSEDEEALCRFGRGLMGARARHGLVRRFRKILGDLMNTCEWNYGQMLERVIYGEEDLVPGVYDETELIVTAAAVETALYHLLKYCGVRKVTLESKRAGRIAAAVIAKGSDFGEALNLIRTDISGEYEQKTGVLHQRGSNENFYSLSVGRRSYEDSIKAQEELLEIIGRLWAGGCSLEIGKINPGRKLHIHGYVFEKEEFEADVKPYSLQRENEVPAQERTVRCSTEEDVFEVFADIWEEVLGEKNITQESDFFEAGGDSLGSIRMAALIERNFGVSIPQDILFEKSSAGEITAWIYAHLEMGKNQQEFSKREILPLETQEFYQTSAAQKRLYTVQSMQPESVAYNLAAVYVVEGEIDVQRVKETVQRLVERHEAFRTSFGVRDGEIVQYIAEKVQTPIEFSEEKSAGLKELIREFVQPFDLTKAPLLRMKVVRISENKHYFLMDMHHIISDQSSIDVLMKDFYALYVGENLTPLKIHFKDFAAWQNKKIKDGEMDQQLSYWMKQFCEEALQTDLHHDYLVPAKRSFSGKKLHFAFGSDLCGKLDAFAGSNNVTPYMVMFLTLELLLWKYTQQKNLIIGTAVEGRRNAGLQDLVGMFVNTLAVCTSVDEEKNIKQQLEDVKKTILAAFENQDCQFDSVVEELRNRTGMNETLIHVMMNYVTKGTQEICVDGLKMYPYEEEEISAKFDLMFVLEKCDSSYAMDIEYASELFAEETIRQMGRNFLLLLDMVIGNAQLPVKELALPLTKSDQMLYEKINDKQQIPVDRSIAEIFEEVAEREKERVAVKCGEAVTTYEELNQLADFLGIQLRQMGIRRHDRVALILEPGVLQIASIIAVLKCGACYVPIDPQYPKDRIEFMLSDSAAGAVIVQECYAGISGNCTKELVISEDTIRNRMQETECGNFVREEELSINDEAYIIYTSGSTGKPKGVSVSGKNILRIAYQPNYMQVCPGDCILQLANYAFDASIFEIFTTILTGAYCVVISKDALLDFSRLSQILGEQRIKATFITAALFNMIVDYDANMLKNIDKILVGGEALSVSHMRRALNVLGKGHLYNGYGPTETTVFATFYPIDEIEDHCESIPIGHAVSDTTLYVLDTYGHLVPAGVPGELCVGGSGVANGYINNQELTRERFQHITFGNKERIYRTGDRVILRNDGEIIYIGRTDFQVKINGFRIELREIEKQFDSIEGVKETAVLVQKDSQGAKYVAAYYTLQEKKYEYLTPAYISSYLRNLVPVYMIPAKIVCVEQMPLNANKKIDYTKLAQMREDTPVYQGAAESQKNLKASVKYVLDVMREALSNPGIHPEDNFFFSGGTSIRAIAMAQKFREAGYEVGVNDILTHPTASELAELPAFQRLDKQEGQFANAVNKRPVRHADQEELEGIVQYSYMASDILRQVLQKGKTVKEFAMAAVQELHLEKTQRVSGMSVQIYTAKSTEDVKAAIAQELCRHQLLHAAADFERKVWLEKEISISNKQLAQYISVVDATMYDDATKEVLEEMIQTNMITQAPKSGEVMWKLCCIKESDESYRILWIFDHICFDGMSAEVIRQDLLCMLATSQDNGEIALQKPQTYSDYVENMQKNREISADLETLKEGFQNWNDLNDICIASIEKKAGDIKQIQMRMQLGENSEEAFDLALKGTIRFLQSYLCETEIPMMILNYGRVLKEQEYYNCVGEFLDLLPVVLKEECPEKIVEDALKRKEGVNLIDVLANAEDSSLFEELYSREGRGAFILWNFQGYVEGKERETFEEAVQSLPSDMLADFVIVAGYDATGIYVHLESVYGFDIEALKDALSGTGFHLEDEV